jgi:hypothetical protein
MKEYEEMAARNMQIAGPASTKNIISEAGFVKVEDEETK